MSAAADSAQQSRSATRWSVVRVLVALVYSVALIVPWLLDVTPALTWASWACAGVLWVYLAADYVIRLVRSDDRRGFVRHAVATPLLLLSPILIALNVPAALVVTVFIVAFVIEVRHLSFGHQFTLAVIAIAGVGIIAAIAMAIFERNEPKSQLKTVGDSFTWALSTVLDVRGDDARPLTENGRILGVVVVLCGVLFTWAMFSQITSWILGGKQRSLDHDDVDAIVRRALADAAEGKLTPHGPVDASEVAGDNLPAERA